MTGLTSFEAHNDGVRTLWADYRAGRPSRVPVVFGINTRYFLLDPATNRRRITFRQYCNDPETMLETQLEFLEWVRMNVPQDAEMGLPERWDVYVDFQNYYEAGFLGSPVYFPDDNVPAAEPFLDDEHKRMLLEEGLPELDDLPLWRRNVEFYEYLVARRDAGFEYRGRPLGVVTPKGGGTDGPMTLFMSMRGTGALLDMYTDPEYFREMMEYLTEFIIMMIRTARRITGQPEKQERFGFADDSVELVSLRDYREFVLPSHKRLIAELGGNGPNSIHVCGDVQRLFGTFIDELCVRSIDTGFPINWRTLRDEVGDGVEIYGGVHIDTLLRGTPETVTAEARSILQSGIMRGGKFVLREANNLAPFTPPANMRAMYEAAKRFGQY